MDKPWLSQYPAGVPAEIDIQQFSSLADMLAASCTRFADLPAYRSMGSVDELSASSTTPAARSLPGCRKPPTCSVATGSP